MEILSSESSNQCIFAQLGDSIGRAISDLNKDEVISLISIILVPSSVYVHTILPSISLAHEKGKIENK